MPAGSRSGLGRRLPSSPPSAASAMASNASRLRSAATLGGCSPAVMLRLPAPSLEIDGDDWLALLAETGDFDDAVGLLEEW